MGILLALALLCWTLAFQTNAEVLVSLGATAVVNVETPVFWVITGDTPIDTFFIAKQEGRRRDQLIDVDNAVEVQTNGNRTGTSFFVFRESGDRILLVPIQFQDNSFGNQEVVTLGNATARFEVFATSGSSTRPSLDFPPSQSTAKPDASSDSSTESEPASTPPGAPRNGLAPGVIAGIVVGTVCFLGLLAIFIVLVLRSRRHRQEKQAHLTRSISTKQTQRFTPPPTMAPPPPFDPYASYPLPPPPIPPPDLEANYYHNPDHRLSIQKPPLDAGMNFVPLTQEQMDIQAELQELQSRRITLEFGSADVKFEDRSVEAETKRRAQNEEELRAVQRRIEELTVLLGEPGGQGPSVASPHRPG